MERETSILVQRSLSVERGRWACSSDDHNDDDLDGGDHNDDDLDGGDHNDDDLDGGDHNDEDLDGGHDSGHDVGHDDDDDDLRLQNLESVIILKPT